jgi:hypothetical protein
MTDKTTAARQHEPVAEPCAVGISSNVKAELHKINPEIRQRIEEHLEQKNGYAIR